MRGTAASPALREGGSDGVGPEARAGHHLTHRCEKLVLTRTSPARRFQRLQGRCFRRLNMVKKGMGGGGADKGGLRSEADEKMNCFFSAAPAMCR